MDEGTRMFLKAVQEDIRELRKDVKALTWRVAGLSVTASAVASVAIAVVIHMVKG